MVLKIGHSPGQKSLISDSPLMEGAEITHYRFCCAAIWWEDPSTPGRWPCAQGDKYGSSDDDDCPL